jgi:NADH:ubiquinone reductase (H+-translocating)
MQSKKRILILGGGYGGVRAGKILEKKFRKRNDVEITLVDSKPFHTLMTELHEVAAWRAEPESVQVSFRKIFGTKRIDCVVDTIASVDFEARIARSARREYPFDYILIGTGAQPEFFGTPGVKENCFTLWSFDDAMRIRHHLETVFEKAAEEADPIERRRLFTFVVAGAGFTGIEMAGELLEYRDSMCRRHFIDAAETRVIVIEALPSILPMLEERLRAKVEHYLRKKGCKFMLNSPIVGAEPGKVLVKESEPVETATFIWTCGVKGNEFGARLGLPLGKRDRIETDAGLRSGKQPFVYAMGDAAGLVFEGKPMSMIVESAHFSAETAARNVIADVEGGEKHEFDPRYHGFMVSAGSHYGVSNAGGIQLSGFLALAMKHFINMYYLFGIAGLNQVWEYFKHEFLDMASGRSLVGGFFSYKLRGYWALPLRLWLGVAWVFEGVNKIGEGWLAFSSGSQSGWMFSQGVKQAGMKAASDATSAATSAATTAAAGAGVAATSAATTAAAGTGVAATSAATSAATAAAGAGVAATSAATAAAGSGASGVAAVSAATGAATTAAAGAGVAATSAATSAATGTGSQAVHDAFHDVWDLAKPIFDPNGAIVHWFKTVFMDGIFASIPFQVFQSMVVATEIGIGLIFLGGLFTWFGAVGSIGLCLVFTLSGMFRWDQLWFVFAAIVMMGGAGRAFGLDYWSVPFFKRWWNGTRVARRTHLYGDDPTK